MKKKLKLKLYIWDNFSRDYSPGLAFAIAASAQEARQLVTKDYGCDPMVVVGDPEVRRVDHRVGRSVSGGGWP